MYSTSNLDIVRHEDLDVVICLNPTSSLHPTRAWNPGEWIGARRARAAPAGASAARRKQAARPGTEVVLVQPTKEDLDAMGAAT